MYQVISDRAQNNFDEMLDRASQDPEGVAIVFGRHGQGDCSLAAATRQGAVVGHR